MSLPAPRMISPDQDVDVKFLICRCSYGNLERPSDSSQSLCVLNSKTGLQRSRFSTSIPSRCQAAFLIILNPFADAPDPLARPFALLVSLIVVVREICAAVLLRTFKVSKFGTLIANA